MSEPAHHAATTPSDGEETFDSEVVLEIVEMHGEDRGGLITILEEIQGECGYLPKQALRLVADRLGRSLVDVYAVATFYRSFSLTPRGRHFVCACLGTACHVRSAPMVAEELERQLGIRAGETTADREFTLETVNCLGACALGPIVVVDGRYYPKMNTAKVQQLLAKIRGARPAPETPSPGLSAG